MCFFVKKVLFVYNGVCVICGEYFVGGFGVFSGIEVVYIFFWLKFDFDEVCNGFVLCK